MLLSKNFKNDTLGKHLELKPLIIITSYDKSEGIHTPLYSFSNDRLLIPDQDDNTIRFEPILQKVSNVKSTTDYDSKKFKINRMRFTLYNYYDSKIKFGAILGNDNLAGKHIFLYYKTPSTSMVTLPNRDVIVNQELPDNSCALIFSGLITRLSTNDKKIDIQAEDATQLSITESMVPFYRLDYLSSEIQDQLQGFEEDETVPMVFGRVDKAPVKLRTVTDGDTHFHFIHDRHNLGTPFQTHVVPGQREIPNYTGSLSEQRYPHKQNHIYVKDGSDYLDFGLRTGYPTTNTGYSQHDIFKFFTQNEFFATIKQRYVINAEGTSPIFPSLQLLDSQEELSSITKIHCRKFHFPEAGFMEERNIVDPDGNHEDFGGTGSSIWSSLKDLTLENADIANTDIIKGTEVFPRNWYREGESGPLNPEQWLSPISNYQTYDNNTTNSMYWNRWKRFIGTGYSVIKFPDEIPISRIYIDLKFYEKFYDSTDDFPASDQTYDSGLAVMSMHKEFFKILHSSGSWDYNINYLTNQFDNNIHDNLFPVQGLSSTQLISLYAKSNGKFVTSNMVVDLVFPPPVAYVDTPHVRTHNGFSSFGDNPSGEYLSEGDAVETGGGMVMVESDYPTFYYYPSHQYESWENLNYYVDTPIFETDKILIAPAPALFKDAGLDMESNLSGGVDVGVRNVQYSIGGCAAQEWVETDLNENEIFSSMRGRIDFVYTWSNMLFDNELSQEFIGTTDIIENYSGFTGGLDNINPTTEQYQSIIDTIYNQIKSVEANIPTEVEGVQGTMSYFDYWLSRGGYTSISMSYDLFINDEGATNTYFLFEDTTGDEHTPLSFFGHRNKHYQFRYLSGSSTHPIVGGGLFQYLKDNYSIDSTLDDSLITQTEYLVKEMVIPLYAEWLLHIMLTHIMIELDTHTGSTPDELLQSTALTEAFVSLCEEFNIENYHHGWIDFFKWFVDGHSLLGNDYSTTTNWVFTDLFTQRERGLRSIINNCVRYMYAEHGDNMPGINPYWHITQGDFPSTSDYDTFAEYIEGFNSLADDFMLGAMIHNLSTGYAGYLTSYGMSDMTQTEWIEHTHNYTDFILLNGEQAAIYYGFMFYSQEVGIDIVSEGASMDSAVIQRPSDIIMNILTYEMGFSIFGEFDPIGNTNYPLPNSDRYDIASIQKSRDAHSDWEMGFAINKQVEAKNLFEKIMAETKSYLKFTQEGRIGFITILDSYTYDDIDIMIESSDVIKYNIKKSKIEDIIISSDYSFRYDNGMKKYIMKTGYKNITDILPDYDSEYYNLSSTVGNKEKNLRYHTDLTTAGKFQNFELLNYCNIHNIISLELPLNYIMDTGSIIHIPLINDDMAFGMDYSKVNYINGQYIYPLWIVMGVDIGLNSVKIVAHQLTFLGTSGEHGFMFPEEDSYEIYGCTQEFSNLTYLEEPIPNWNYNPNATTNQKPNGDFITGKPYGDLNSDGGITINDCVILIQMILNNSITTAHQSHILSWFGSPNINTLIKLNEAIMENS